MATKSLPEFHDDAPRYQELVRDATKDLDEKLAEYTSSGEDALPTTYLELVAQTKEYKGSYQYLMIAIIAGERLLLATSTPDVNVSDIQLRLADLLARRSRWDILVRFKDLERALALATESLEGAENDQMRIDTLKKLGAFYEQAYGCSSDGKQLKQAWAALEGAAELSQEPDRGMLLASAACLRFKVDPDALKCILDITDDALSKKPVTWAAVARKKFRFIDARHLASCKGLRVVEFDVLPHQRYVPLSYIWRGSYNAASQPTRTMSIEGAVGADPISINVLNIAAECVTTLGCDLLWIDGICIIQNDEEDKAWQIQRMFDIYKHCKQCLVIPGGLSRLIPIDEPTFWIHRAWTLQEAVAPQSCTVLFAWTRGTCLLQTHMFTYITEVTPGIAARTDLHSLLSLSLKSSARIKRDPPVPNEPEEEVELRLLVDNGDSNQATALLGAMENRNQEGLEGAILRASLMRIASRPADAVFSIMGILGVDLDPRRFDPFDRTGPTIALMRELLRQGKRAEWLGLAPQMDISPAVPTLPKFPTINEEGKAIVENKGEVVPIGRAMGYIWWRLVDAPYGSMDNDGALTINVPALPMRKESGDTRLEIRPDGYSLWDDSPLGEDVWYPAPSHTGPPYIVKIGNIEQYLNGAQALLPQSRHLLMMLVDEVGLGDSRFRILGYAQINKAVMSLEGWQEMDIVIAAHPSEKH